MLTKLKINHPKLKGYDKEYQDNVRPELVRDEPERRGRVKLGLVLAALLIPPSVWLAWYFGYAASRTDSRAFMLMYLIPLGGYLCIVGSLMRRTKFTLVKSLAGFLGWQHAEGGAQGRLIERLEFFGLFPEHDNRRIGDYFRGQHEDWPFEMSEVRLTKNKGWGNNRRTVIVFQGVVLTFKLSYTSSAVTVITRDRSVGHPKLSNFIHHEGSYQDDLGEVIVRSSDIASINTVLCSRFQAVLRDLTQSLPSVNVSCLVDKHYLHIPLEAQDRFEVDMMFEPMGSSVRAQKMVDEFSEVLVLLDIVLKRRACLASNQLDYPAFRASVPDID